YPYLAVWTAWELLGQWTPYTLHQVLRLPFPLTLCLHFETPELSRAKALLTSHRNALGSQVNAPNSWVPRDPMAQAAYVDVEIAEQRLERGERLHLLTLAVLLQGATLAQLRERGAYVKQLLGAHCRLRLE